MASAARPVRLLALVLTAALALALSGCNDKHAAYRHADTEGLYIAAGGLKYQVQVSREVNPRLAEDRSFLEGLGASTTALGRNEVWFAVFLRVENDGDRPVRSADSFEIVDTTGRTFRPQTIDPSRNNLAYTPTTLVPGGVFPNQNSIAGQAGPQGGLLLFKLDNKAYQNRPLNLNILTSDLPKRVDGSVELDL